MAAMKSFIVTTGMLLLLSCTKTPDLTTAFSPRPVCQDCHALQLKYRDSAEYPTILGEKYRNPYLLPNMNIAFRNVYKRNAYLKTTHLYLKFSPANFEELAELEDQDIDLFDYPLDRELITEGDYYPQEGKQEEDIPEFYAVVEISKKLPAAIPMQVLAEMHIPDNDPALENEALRLTNTLDLAPPDGGPKTELTPYSDPGQLNPYNKNPSGRLQVEQELLDLHTARPLEKVRIVIRRLFKIERLYTDEFGVFQAKKYFRNEYTILAKFKNAQGHISRTRPHRIFEQMFPIKVNLGKWSNIDALHPFTIPHVTESATIATSHWCAATTSQALTDFHRLCRKYGVGTPPDAIRIILNYKKASGHGNTYMLHDIMKDNAAYVIAGEVLTLTMLTSMTPIGPAAVVALTAFIHARAPDIQYGYGGDPAFLTTDRYAELVMHELGHASHYHAVGAVWWAKLGLAEATNKGEGTYGACCTDKARRIALGEGWAYLIGHFFADARYGLHSTPFPEQGFIDSNRNVLIFINQPKISSHIHFLESFNPNRKEDPSVWIPKGLLYDLIDPAEELFPESGIEDPAGGYNCQQIFSVMTRNIENIDDFKKAFVGRYGGSSSQSIERLFAQYGY